MMTMAMPADDGHWSPALVALAATIKPDPLGFDKVWERVRQRYRFSLRRDTGLSENFVAEALSTAQNYHVLRAFATELVKADLTEAGFDEQLLTLLPASAYTLQAFQNGDYLPKNALLSAKGMLRACDYVCQINIKGEHKGTGVLVRPTLVATAAHVVWDLVEPQRDGTLRARPDSLKDLVVLFNDVEDYLPESTKTTRRDPELAAPHPDWLAWGSQPTTNERSRALFDVRNIEGINNHDGPWDLALIRLAAPRPTASPELVSVSGRRYEINVLHHPARASGGSEPLLWSIGMVDEPLGDPAVRALHNANTLGGSSGAPVYDSKWRIVALHQGGSRDLQSHADAAGLCDTDRNRAVPVGCWSTKLDLIEMMTDEVPYLPYPVIGRRATQERIWRGMRFNATAAERLLIIRGEPGTGLKYTKRLVRELVLPHSPGVAAALDVSNMLQDDVETFAHRIVGALAAELRLPDPAGTTTKQNDVRNAIAPSLGAKLETLAGDRPTWLVLEGFEHAGTTEQSGVNNLLLSLIQNLEQHPSLRLVLVGWQQTTPESFAVSVEDLAPPTAEDIVHAGLESGEEPNPLAIVVARQYLDEERRDGHAGYDAATRVFERLRPLLAQVVAMQDGAR